MLVLNVTVMLATVQTVPLSISINSTFDYNYFYFNLFMNSYLEQANVGQGTEGDQMFVSVRFADQLFHSIVIRLVQSVLSDTGQTEKPNSDLQWTLLRYGLFQIG